MKETKKLLRTLLFVIQKGGVGKTTSVKSLAAALSLLGKKVLLIDLDPQANATLGLIGAVPSKETIYNLLMDSTLNWKDYVKTYEKGQVRFDILPGGNNLAFAELELASKSGREFIFRNRILSKIEAENDYDFVLIDCQPSLGLLVVNVLCSSNNNEIIICARPDEDSQEAISFLFRSIKSLREDLGVMPKGFRILLTQLIEEQKSHRKNLNEIEAQFPKELFNVQIRKDTKLEQARDERTDIFNFAPETRSAQEYMKIAKQLVENQ